MQHSNTRSKQTHQSRFYGMDSYKKTPYPNDQSIHQLFELQTEKTPDALAAVHLDTSLSYRELNRQANRFARYLQSLGAENGQAVMIFMNRGINTLVSILAVLKTGAAYISVDMETPSKRINCILNDSEADIIVIDNSSKHLLSHINLANQQVVNASDIEPYAQDSENLLISVNPEAEAYYIYTSGSTGTPKGVVVHHRGLVNYTCWAAKTYVDESIQGFALYSSLTFDLTITSIFVPLISGRIVYIYEDREDNVPTLNRVLEDNQVDVLKLTPSHAAIILSENLAESKLKVLIFGGEEFKSNLALKVDVALSGRARLYNEYGPTETVVGCTFHLFDPTRDNYGSVPLGEPIDNMHVLLLDEQLEPVKRGQIGQLYIGGDGVALGYRNDEEKTNSSFLPHPYVPGARLYMTGDLARVSEVGELHYLGRSDCQIKINGYRIEMGEIEQTLAAYPGIEQCVVSSTKLTKQGLVGTQKIYCKQCGIDSSFPNTTYSEDQICNHCQSFEEYRDVINEYFGTMDDLAEIVKNIKTLKRKKYDCIVSFSGGKDSTYALCKMVDMGMRVLAFTLDNGYISDDAKENIERVVKRLEVDHRYMSTPHMNDIFVDSLKRHSNVCNGCFKTIYAFALKLSQEVDVDDIVMGLSKGQLFETRLPALFRAKKFDDTAFQKSLKDARKIYHRVDDAPGRLLNISCVRDDDVIEKVRFIDFYRYCDVSREGMYEYIENRVGWIRPADTGRSTNCLINDVGIYVHNKERQYHNYSLPYSWDVRIGHIGRAEALLELEDSIDIDEIRVNTIMDEIGYQMDDSDTGISDIQLVAYYIAPEEIPVTALQTFLDSIMPHYMVPRQFVHMDQLPLTPNGKVNRMALPRPNNPFETATSGKVESATTELQQELIELWKEILMVSEVRLEDDFFDLGGHSLPALMLLYKVFELYQKTISIQDFSKAPTIIALSESIEK